MVNEATAPNLFTVAAPPHWHNGRTVTLVMIETILALLPAAGMAVYSRFSRTAGHGPFLRHGRGRGGPLLQSHGPRSRPWTTSMPSLWACSFLSCCRPWPPGGW